MTARDAREFDEVFGNVWADKEKGVLIGLPPSESGLRRNLASAAHAFGWLVEEEVVVPDWGRIDLILRDGLSAPLLVELKMDLTRRSRIRAAFQQTDGYGRWWVQKYGEAVDTLLVAAKMNESVMSDVYQAYPHVGWCSAGVLLGKFVSRGTDEARLLRRRRAVARRASLRRLLDAYEAAVRELPPDPVGDVLGMLDLFDFAGGAA